MSNPLAFDHIHLISQDPHAAARWYCETFGGHVSRVQPDLRGAPQIDVSLPGITVVIRGRRPGESPVPAGPMTHFEGYSSHDGWGVDHFGFLYRGDLRAFCESLKARGVRMAVEPWEFKPGLVICYVAAPDGVSIELMQAPPEAA